MKKSWYSSFCNNKFNRFLKNLDKEFVEEKEIILEKANISLDYVEYTSMWIMNILISYLVCLIALSIIYIFYPNIITIILLISIPLLSVLINISMYLYIPNIFINKREESIDRFLPYAINYISSMAVAGVSPSEIFVTLSTISVYGEIQIEARRIAKEINLMGIDSITALKHAIELSPSKKFVSFLQGIIGTIQSGSDLNSYLGNVSDKFLEEDLIERKKNLELLSVVAEAFVISVIAFPIFLVIILSIMGFFGGSMDVSIQILFIFSFLILPLVYIAFYVLVRSASAENLTKYSPDINVIEFSYFKEHKKEILILTISVLIAFIFTLLSYFALYIQNIEPTIYFNFDIVFIVFLIIIFPLSYYLHLKNKEKKEIQERLPDFLIEISDSITSGMTTFEAIKSAEKGRYGKLNKEIKKMKSQLSWNLSVSDVFSNFSSRVKSGIIQRIVITINEGLLMGGKTAEIFKAASKEVNQVNSIEHQRKANMSIYMSVIILCFFVFLAIILILDKTIFESFFELQLKQATQISGIINISKIDPILLKYSLFSFVYVQSIGAGILAGYMMDGKVTSGFRYACVLAIISFLVFKLLF